MNDLSPTEFQLAQNHPNPFSESTTIKFCIPRQCHVLLTVRDTSGNLVQKLVDDRKHPGTFEVTFFARRFPAGEYVCKMNALHFEATRIMALQRKNRRATSKLSY